MTPELSHAADHDRAMTLVERRRKPRTRPIKTTFAIPQMRGFLPNFGDLGIRTTPRAAELLGCSELARWAGLAFALPMVPSSCDTPNMISRAVLRRGRTYAAVGLLILTALIARRTDALGTLAIWVALYLCLELGLLLTRFARPRGGVAPSPCPPCSPEPGRRKAMGAGNNRRGAERPGETSPERSCIRLLGRPS